MLDVGLFVAIMPTKLDFLLSELPGTFAPPFAPSVEDTIDGVSEEGSGTGAPSDAHR